MAESRRVHMRARSRVRGSRVLRARAGARPRWPRAAGRGPRRCRYYPWPGVGSLILAHPQAARAFPGPTSPGSPLSRTRSRPLPEPPPPTAAASSLARSPCEQMRLALSARPGDQGLRPDGGRSLVLGATAARPGRPARLRPAETIGRARPGP